MPSRWLYSEIGLHVVAVIGAGGGDPLPSVGCCYSRIESVQPSGQIGIFIGDIRRFMTPEFGPRLSLLKANCTMFHRPGVWQRTLPVVAWISFAGYTTYCQDTLVSLPTQSVQPLHAVRFDRRGWSRIPTNVQRVLSSFTR